MKDNLKYFTLLLLLFVIINCAGLALRSIFTLSYSTTDLVFLSFSFTVVSAAALIIFFRGLAREDKEQIMYSFVAISTKFLVELVIAFAWFLIAKKTSITYIIIFFVLYLSFSIFSISVILKILKKKSL